MIRKMSFKGPFQFLRKTRNGKIPPFAFPNRNKIIPADDLRRSSEEGLMQMRRVGEICQNAPKKCPNTDGNELFARLGAA